MAHTITITITDEQYAALEALQDSYPAGGVYVDLLSGYDEDTDEHDPLGVVISSHGAASEQIVKVSIAADGAETVSVAESGAWTTSPARYRGC